MKDPEITFCVTCGARFKDNEGWLDPHKMPCANARYGWVFTCEQWPMKLLTEESQAVLSNQTSP